MNIIEVLNRHTGYSFESIEILFKEIDEPMFQKEINGFPIWQQLYHMINSMDRIFIDPETYQYPSFHKEDMNNLEIKSKDYLSKEILWNYYLNVKNSINKYLNRLNENELFLISHHKNIRMTKLDHILAQLRHMAWHIGYLHSCLKVVNGHTPDHILIRSIE